MPRDRHRMRCSQSPSKGCGRRFKIYRKPHTVLKSVTCPYCGSKNVNSTEAARRAETERLKDKVHTCSGYSFPHVIGVLRGCDNHPKAGQPMTHSEKAEYERLTAKEYDVTP